MTIELARRAAIVFGVALPLVETARRWGQLGDIRVWPFWLDDWAIGAFLVYGAWRAGKDLRTGQPILAASLAFAAGMGYASFFSQLAEIDRADPSGVSSMVVVAIKGAMFVLAVVAVIVVLNWTPASDLGRQQ
jgi:hypothetical protein